MRVDGDTPSLRVKINEEPATLGMNPGMLVFPAYSFYDYRAHSRPVVINCNQSVSDLDQIKDNLGIDC